MMGRRVSGRRGGLNQAFNAHGPSNKPIRRQPRPAHLNQDDNDHGPADKENKKPPEDPDGGTPGEREYDRDAFAQLKETLLFFDLPELEDWLIERLIEGVGQAELMLRIQQHPAFRQKFAVVEAARAAGIPDVTAAKVLQYRRDLGELAAQFGFDLEVLSPPKPRWATDGSDNEYGGPEPDLSTDDLVSRLILGRKNLDEVRSNFVEGYRRVTQTPPEVRQFFAENYGIAGDAMLAMYFISPSTLTSDELVRQAKAAEIGGYGRIQNIDLTRERAERLALGNVTAAQAQEGFTRLDELRPLFAETLAEGSDFRIEEEGVGAVFGDEPGYQRALRRRLAGRVSTGEGGGSTTMTRERTGLGTYER